MKRSALFLTAVLIVFAASIQSIEIYPDSNWTQPKEKKVKYFKPAAYFMFGLDYRTDDHTRLYVSPGVIADFLIQLNPVVGIKAGIGYNAQTKYSGIDGIRTYSADMALHLELPTGGFQPFVESGLRYMKYEETGGTSYRTEGRTGIFIGLGVSLFLKNDNRIDLSVNALLNHFDNTDYYEVNLPDNYGGDIADRPVDGLINEPQFSRQLYNPATLELELRLKL